jgi:3-deoxy-D-manno-octulosonic-acid transferase
VDPREREALIGSRESGVESRESAVVLFSELNAENVSSAQVIIVDGIGYLSHLYQYAHIAYIGGGFGAGIHNILEAATFGKPMIFGPKYQKFREAADLVDAGGAYSIGNFEELRHTTRQLLENEQSYRRSSLICSSYVNEKQGATKIILDGIGS